jgi:hypothetical protein
VEWMANTSDFLDILQADGGEEECGIKLDEDTWDDSLLINAWEKGLRTYEVLIFFLFDLNR